MRLAEWVREALLAAPMEPGMGSGVDSGEVALAEVLDCPLVTADARLARAPGIECAVEVLVT